MKGDVYLTFYEATALWSGSEGGKGASDYTRMRPTCPVGEMGMKWLSLVTISRSMVYAQIYILSK